jgi:hypothetical protein
VKDRHARTKEPYLNWEIHEAALRLGALEVLYKFSEPDVEDNLDESRNIIGTGSFRFIAVRKSGVFPH